jgi:hypothetical protein
MLISGPLEATQAVHLDGRVKLSFGASVDSQSVFEPVEQIGSGGFGVI